MRIINMILSPAGRDARAKRASEAQGEAWERRDSPERGSEGIRPVTTVGEADSFFRTYFALTNSHLIPTIRLFSNRFNDFGKTR